MRDISKYNLLFNGRIYKKGMTAAEIAEVLNCEKNTVYKAAMEGTKIKKHYSLERVETAGQATVLDPKSKIPSEFEKQWREETARFKNVQWVKIGGKKLQVNRACRKRNL